jgi:hypothetical protein
MNSVKLASTIHLSLRELDEGWMSCTYKISLYYLD